MIGNDVWIGQNAVILPGVHIGDGAIIGANSVVGCDVAPYTIVIGNPAKELRKRFDGELINLMLRFRWWDKSIERKECRKMRYSPIGDSWDDFETEIFTPEEIAASDLRVALINELICARNEKGITQRELEELSGVSQPVIARMESGAAVPKLDTVIKILAALGKTLAIVPLETVRPAK